MSISELHIANIAIDVIRKDIKNMHLAVYPPTGRVRLAVPNNTSDDKLRLFAINKLGWIKKNMRAMQEQTRELPKKYENRESFYLFGTRYLLKIIEAENYGVSTTKKHVKLSAPKVATLAKKASTIDQWYRTELATELPAMIAKWEKKVGVKSNKWSLRKMRTKWGSCNPDTKAMLFNPELAKKPFMCIEYVVLHELVHLKERNHNKNFIHLMDTYMPDWEYVREELNKVVV